MSNNIPTDNTLSLHKIFDDIQSPEEKNAEFFREHNDPKKGSEGLARRKAMTDKGVRTKRVDYSDKGDHDYYTIGAYTKKCRKCEIIVDITFNTPWYLPRDGEQQWVEPPCTWKGRALPKVKK